MISVSSVVSALLAYSAVLLVVCLVHLFSSEFVEKGGASILLLVAAIGTVRLILPIELPLTRAIRSWPMGEPVRLIRTYPDIITLLVMIWVAGGIVMACRDVYKVYRAYKISRRYRPAGDECARIQEIAKELGISCPVVVSSDVRMAYVEKVFHYTIYLPILVFPEKEIEYVLLHEKQHILNHDYQIKLFFRVLLIVMWWNPIMHWFWHILRKLLEVRCDQEMTRDMDYQDRKDYAEMLAGLTAVLAGRESLSPLAVDEFFGFGKSKGKDKLMAQRTYVILHEIKKMSRRASVVFGCVAVALFFASYLVMFQPAGVPSAEMFQNDSRTFYHDNYDGPDMNDRPCGTFIYKGSDGRYQLFIDYVFNRHLSEDEVNSSEYKDFYFFEEEKLE